MSVAARRGRIAVDAMGGDHAPGPVVDGALAAARYSGVAVTLVGRPDAVDAELARHPDAATLDVEVVAAADVVAMDESPASALRRKPRASIRVATELVRDGEAAAVVSAGHTGAAGAGSADPHRHGGAARCRGDR